MCNKFMFVQHLEHIHVFKFLIKHYNSIIDRDDD